MRNTFIEYLTQQVETNPDIMLLTADLGYGVLTKFAEQYPRQYLNVGVAEQNMIGVATGLALSGKIVFTYSIANFPVARCLEQIRNDACYHELNVNIVAVGSGFSYGAAGMSHHATEDIAMMRALPITIVSPGDIWEVQHAVKAIIETPSVCYLRIDKGHQQHPDYLPKPDEKFQLGVARKLRDGDAITLIATGSILNTALIAADELATQGIECRVLSMHTIKPLDTNAIDAAVEKTGGIITIEEHTVEGGLGSAVAECCLENTTRPKIFHRIGLRHGLSSAVGSQEYLRNRYHIGVDAIVDQVKKLL